jgi:transposase-like protein
MEEPNMELSRRSLMCELKLAAMEQLESEASVATVARALEVTLSLLQRWRQEFRESPGE